MGAVAGKKLEVVRCSLCDNFTSKRLTSLEKHFSETHSTTSQAEWDRLNAGPTLCACGCEEATSWRGWKQGYALVVVGHNGSIEKVYGPDKAREISDKRKQRLIGRPSWAKGLTKESDERIAKRGIATAKGRKKAFADGKITAWSKGLSKETDERLARAAEDTRERFQQGQQVAWHAGKDETTDPRIKKKNDALREAYASGKLQAWHGGLTQATDPRLSAFSTNGLAMWKSWRLTNEEIEQRLQKNVNLSLERIDSYKRGNVAALWVRCRTCQTQEKVSLAFASNDRCKKCTPAGSRGQNEVADWLEALGVVVGRNIRGIISNRLELDVFVPAHKLAIEYNGLYWHNEGAGKDAQYHQNKSDRCADAGITLFHVFEDEWRDRRPIVQSMIRHRLGLTPNRVMARKCAVVGLSPARRKAFFDANHIDGDTRAQQALGLELGGEVVAAMSLRTPFHKKHAASLEVGRFCSKLDTSVIGGLGRLTRAAQKTCKEQGYSSLLTYVDARLGAREGWSAAGWKKVAETGARFWWTDFNDRFNRFKFKADRARGLTEAQVAEAAGVVRIYGCKNLRFELSVGQSPSASGNDPNA